MKLIFQQPQVQRVPQHMPQSLIPGQKIQSQTLFKPIDFIQSGQQRLETSEIVYKNRNPAVVGQQQQVVQVQQQQGIQMQPNGWQNSRGQSVDAIRGQTRSL
jgi:hypothetical protein